VIRLFFRSFFTANRSAFADLRDTAAPDLVLNWRTVQCKNVLLSSVQEIWSVLPRRSQALDEFIEGLIRNTCLNICPHNSMDEDDEVSSVNVGRAQGEEFTREDGHILNVLHHVSSFQLNLLGQHLYKEICYFMARCNWR
jgi:hypothetical protein